MAVVFPELASSNWSWKKFNKYSKDSMAPSLAWFLSILSLVCIARCLSSSTDKFSSKDHIMILDRAKFGPCRGERGVGGGSGISWLNAQKDVIPVTKIKWDNNLPLTVYFSRLGKTETKTILRPPVCISKTNAVVVLDGIQLVLLFEQSIRNWLNMKVRNQWREGLVYRHLVGA